MIFFFCFEIFLYFFCSIVDVMKIKLNYEHRNKIKHKHKHKKNRIQGPYRTTL